MSDTAGRRVPRVAVVGAGLSGLAAAGALRRAGLDVVVFEKSRGLGGRLATRRVGDVLVDHGAPALAPAPGSELAEVIAAMGDGRVRVVDGTEVVTFPGGVTSLAKHLGRGLEVRRGVRVAVLRHLRQGIELGDEQSNGHGVVDGVVVSAPAPQAAELLVAGPTPDPRAEDVAARTYAPALVVLLGVPESPPTFARLELDDGPIMRVWSESAKGRPPVDGVVALTVELARGTSEELFEAGEAEILDLALPELGAHVPVAVDPVWTQVKRWRLAHPLGPGLSQEALNADGRRVVLCGDAVVGEDAAAVYASGLRAAARLVETLAA